MWTGKLDWYKVLNNDVTKKWQHVQHQVLYIHGIQIPRQVIHYNSISMQLHGFADASQKAYGCAIYIRSVSKIGEILVGLLCFKSRVATIKKITPLRLELCAALLLTKFMYLVLQKIKLEFESV